MDFVLHPIIILFSLYIWQKTGPMREHFMSSFFGTFLGRIFYDLYIDRAVVGSLIHTVGCGLWEAPGHHYTAARAGYAVPYRV